MKFLEFRSVNFSLCLGRSLLCEIVNLKEKVMAVSVCSIDEEMNKELRAFRFSRSRQPRAMILKIDPVSKELKADGDLMEDVTLEDLKEELPGHQPRFIL